MKIAFAIDDTLDVSDGVQQAVITIGEKMRSMGHDVYYLTSLTKRKDLKNIYSLTKYFKVAFNGNKMRIPLPVSGRKIKKLLEKEKFDVIHVQMPYSPFFVAKIINKAPENTRIIGTFHILPYKSINKVATYLLGLISLRSIRKIKQVVSVSDPARVFCKEVFRVDSIIIPNPVDINFFKQSKPSPKGKKQIVFLGRLVKRKGVKELVTAYKELLNTNPELVEKTTLLIAGSGVEEVNLKKMLDSMPIGSSVKFLGYINESEKPYLLANADIAVFPSLSGESFGIVLIEAMAAGSKQVLAGDNPGYRSVMQDFPKLLINPKNVEEFANRLFELLEDNDMNRRQSKILHEYVEKFDVSKVCAKLLGLYKS